MNNDARSHLQQQRAKQQQQQKQSIDSAQKQPVMKLGDRDPYTGKFALNSAAGTETNRATKIYDARADQQPVLAHQLPGGSWVADGHKAIEGTGIVGPLEPDNPGYIKGQVLTERKSEGSEGLPIKYLYSVLRGGQNKFYVGGWKSKSVAVPGIPSTARQPKLTNQGKDKWLVSWYEGSQIIGDPINGYAVVAGAIGKTIDSSGKTTTFNAGSNASLSGIGWGNWTGRMPLWGANFTSVLAHRLNGVEYTTQGSGAGYPSQWEWVDLINPSIQATNFVRETELETLETSIRNLQTLAANKTVTHGVAALQSGVETNILNWGLGTVGQPSVAIYNGLSSVSFETVSLVWFSPDGQSEPVRLPTYPGDQTGYFNALYSAFDGGFVNDHWDIISTSRFARLTSNLRVDSSGSLISNTVQLTTAKKFSVQFWSSEFNLLSTKSFKCFPPDQFNDNSTTVFSFINASYSTDVGTSAQPPNSRLGYE